MTSRRVLVVGGGITGLAAAARLVDANTKDDAVDVELWEASDRLGGKIATSPFGGLDHVDEGADAYLRRVPHAVAFARKVGLGSGDLTSPTDATAMVWYDELHPMPGGIVLGVPASVRPFVTTSLLSWRGKLRAAAEPFLPRTDPDDSIGALVRARFGFEVHDRLVDALVGSIYATDTDRASLAAVPQLAELAKHNRSLLIGGRAARRRAAANPGAGGPIFDAPVAGMGALVVAAERYVKAEGGRIRTGCPVRTLEAGDGAWVVDGERFDAVVLALPARAAADLVKTAAPEAAEGLATFEHADVTLVRVRCAAGAIPIDVAGGHSGYLVPKSRQRFVTAVSFGSEKWAHWRPSDGSQILRVSLGRDGLPVTHLDDEAVTDAVVTEVGGHLGIDLQPAEVSISRWPGAFPQYRPHHVARVEALQRAVPAGIHLAGASYRGIGIPACIADGERAGDQAIDGLCR
jgi:oxygen-dependent protoporphyrinogen oxidase